MSDSKTSCIQANKQVAFSDEVAFTDDDFYDCEEDLDCNVFVNTGRYQQTTNFVENRKSLGCTCKTVAEMKANTCDTCFVDSICQDVCNLKHFEANYSLTKAEQEEYKTLVEKCVQRILDIDANLRINSLQASIYSK